MTLKEKILDDMKNAMRSKDSERLSVLRMVKAAVTNKEIDKGEDLSDEEITSTLNTLVKQRRDSAEQYDKAGRDDLAEKERREIGYIENYLPKSASDEEIEAAVSEAIAETGAESMKDMGAVMKLALAKLSSFTVDGKKVSEIVRSHLS